MPKNNFELAEHLEKFPPHEREKEYLRLYPIVEFKSKSFGFLMTRYEQWKKDHASTDTAS